MELQATKTSVITVTRHSSVELSKAIRKVFLKLTEKFVITDIEYAIDYDTDERENIYSAMILGYLTTGGIIDLSDRDTQFPDGIVLDIQSDEQAPTSAVVGNALRVATVDNNGLMSKADKQVLNQLVLDLTEAKGSITTIEGNITDLQERVTALENKEDNDTIYDDSEIRESLENLRASLTNLQTTSDDSDLELTTDIINLRSELELLKTKSATDDSTLSASIATLETAINQLEAKESHLSDITDIIARLESLETEDESIQSSIGDLTTALTTLRDSYNSTTTSNQTLIESIQSDIAILKAKPDYDDSEIKESIESIEDSLSNLNNYDDTEVKQNISTLQSAVTTLQNREDKDTVYDDSEIQEAIQSIQDTLDSIEEQKTNNTLYNDEEVKESIQVLTTSLTNLTNKETKDISDLNILITNLSATITSIQEALESDIQENAEAIESIQTELTGLKQKDTNFTSTIESIQDSLTTLSGNLTTNASAIDSVRTSVATLEGKVDTNDEEVKGLIDEINESIQALESKEDKDTVYDDTDIQKAIAIIQSAITELQNKEDKDTIYDDSELVSRISDIESSIALDEDSTIVKVDNSVAENLLALETSINTLNITKVNSSDLLISEELEEGEESNLDTIRTETSITDNIKLIDGSLKSIKSRITTLEQKEDKDTVYNDEDIQEAITAINDTLSELQNKEDKDTVYNDEEIRGLINILQSAVTVLQNKEDKDTVYNDTDIQNSLDAVELAVIELQAKPDYDDSEIKSSIASIQSALNNLKNYDDSVIISRVSALENTVKLPTLEEGQVFNYLDKEKTVGGNLNALDSVIKSLSDRLAIKEAEEDKDTVYDDSEIRQDISEIESALSNLNNYDDTSITARVSAIEDDIKLPELEDEKEFNYLDKEKSVGNNLNILDLAIKVLADRLTVEENKEDKDTVYNDEEIESAIQTINSAITELQNKEDKDTVYNDSEIKGLINTLQASVDVLENKEDKDTVYDDTDIKNSLFALNLAIDEIKAKPDYDDSEIKESIESIEDTLSNLNNYDDTSIKQRLSDLEDSIDSLDKSLSDVVTRTGNLEDNISIPELTNGDYDFVDTSKTVGENLAIIDTKISEVNDSLDSKLNSSELIKNGYFTAEKIRNNGNKTMIQDEETGGGIFAVNKTFKDNQTEGIKSFLGVNLGNSSTPIFGQIYAIDLDNGRNGVRVNWNTNRMCYITGNTDSSKTGEARWTPEDREIAVKGDLADYIPKAKYDALVNLLISKGVVTQEEIDNLD